MLYAHITILLLLTANLEVINMQKEHPIKFLKSLTSYSKGRI